MPRRWTGRPVGAPSKLTPEEKAEVYKAFDKYVDEEEYPTVVGFCADNRLAWKYRITRDDLNHWEQFGTLIRLAVSKQERWTEEQARKGKMNPTWAIFKLKQPAIGWRDRSESDITSGGEKIGISLSAEQADQLIRARAAREHSDT